jgi:hypothetical protein
MLDKPSIQDYNYSVYYNLYILACGGVTVMRKTLDTTSQAQPNSQSRRSYLAANSPVRKGLS